MRPPNRNSTSNGSGLLTRSDKRKETSMTVEEHATEFLKSLGLWRLPVDPFAIIREEKIQLAPGKYGAKFDARIEYLDLDRLFVIYYKTAEHGTTAGRVRFSLGHELG